MREPLDARAQLLDLALPVLSGLPSTARVVVRRRAELATLAKDVSTAEAGLEAAGSALAATTEKLGDLLIKTPSGWIPARQIADVKETDGPNQILRENGRRRIVMANGTPSSTRPPPASIPARRRRTRSPSGSAPTSRGCSI